MIINIYITFLNYSCNHTKKKTPTLPESKQTIALKVNNCQSLLSTYLVCTGHHAKCQFYMLAHPGFFLCCLHGIVDTKTPYHK